MDIYVKKTDKKGRGVFAGKDFKKGDIIEVCPVIILDSEDVDKIEFTELINYIFKWDRNTDTSAICLGNGSLYNHCSTNYNSDIELNLENQTITFFALKDISKDEEIVFDYCWDSYDWTQINKKNKHL